MTLRQIRIFIAGIVFSLFFLTFLSGFYLAGIFIFFQFIPSLIAWEFNAVITGFISVLILTIIFGRLYCSILCPLGIFQDIISKITKQKNNTSKLNYSFIRYLILITCYLSLLLGNLLFINILDPYSLFGKIVTTLFLPLVSLLNDSLLLVLKFYNIYIYPIQSPNISLYTFIFVFTFFIFLIVIVSTKGRLYCNTICPVGAFLGIISKFSIFRFSIESDKCISCKLCEKKCKANCIDIDQNNIDMSLCVACFNCIDICPKSAVTYNLSISNKQNISINGERRNFVSKAFALSLSILSIPLRTNSKPLFNHEQPIIPPGSISINHFTSRCIACNLCVASCQTKVLKIGEFQYGVLNIMQPYLDFNKGFCSYECNACLNYCPTQAIMPFNLQEKRLIKIGSVKFSEKYCVVHAKKKDCGACAEVCPTHAVHMIKRDKLFYPNINESLCIGCGACQFVCPTKPKSILVDSLNVHSKAKQQTQEVLKKPQTVNEDFPF
ncbi:MAG: 4Fe-4S binding protein [Desulfobacterales bacterium]|nr:4Fe-4S binding protein [Desulfobacterales bacterium]